MNIVTYTSANMPFDRHIDFGDGVILMKYEKMYTPAQSSKKVSLYAKGLQKLYIYTIRLLPSQ